MDGDTADCNVPFALGDWVIDRYNPGQPGQYTGRCRRAGPHVMVQLSYPGGATGFRPLSSLEIMPAPGSIGERLRNGHFGKVRDLQRLITFEKLKGTLHEVIYSMEAAQIDFYPYQFKPVLKFINSPTERLIIADEVGLGKTIEAALIWLELQARRNAQRLLVVCPKILADKWQDELRTKFLLGARTVDFAELRREISDLKSSGPGQPFVLIATYTGLRPPKSELPLLKEPPNGDGGSSEKTKLLRELRHWSLDYDPFDMVIFDEAHYMRNPATTTFRLGESLASCAGSVLCVSATPVNNSNVDLHSLLRLIDESFFETQGMFETLLEANRPAVQVGNALARIPMDTTLLAQAITGMGASRFISESPLFRQLIENLERLEPDDKARISKCQDIAEKLNLLGGYVNRTRRVQVKENRPLRDPLVLPVDYTPEEMTLYKAILTIVRRKCRRDSRPFYVFQVLGLQLRAASCLPVIAQEIRDGRLGDVGELFDEAMGEDVLDDLQEEEPNEDPDVSEITRLLDYDFEGNDSKYISLNRLLLEIVPDEKVIVFAYYRPTLAYLRRRLMADGVNVTVIHGGIPNQRRWEEIERFKDTRGPRVLLSSEVGSEGIDLQFCRVLVNYDLPWNPMRVEQRIGRVDRVGQQAKRISVVNFKVRHTVEERLYDLLHSKLERFANSLGDLEAVVGREVQQLTVDLLSKELTPEEEQQRIEQSEGVIQTKLLQMQALEESGDVLIAFSDYVQRKIEEDREKGRYIQPRELEDYLSDFFDREFRGCELNYNTPADGCLRIRLSQEAHSSLADFIGNDRSLSARPFRQREFSITFRRESAQRFTLSQRSAIHFVNHLSPLIRWITKVNKERAHGFFDLSAIKIEHPVLNPGDYCYQIERWKLTGLQGRERLAYGVRSLVTGETCTPEESEAVIQHLLHNGRDWDYVDCDRAALSSAYEALEMALESRFSSTVEEFEAENETVHQIKTQRVRAIFDRRIAEHEQRLETLRERGGGDRMIRPAEGLLRAAVENKQKRLRELAMKAKIHFEADPVAVGVFRVVGTQTT